MYDRLLFYSQHVLLCYFIRYNFVLTFCNCALCSFTLFSLCINLPVNGKFKWYHTNFYTTFLPLSRKIC